MKFTIATTKSSPSLRAADERDDAVLAVVAVDPLEARRLEVDLVQRRLRRVDAVQILDEPPQPGVQRLARAGASRGC